MNSFLPSLSLLGGHPEGNHSRGTRQRAVGQPIGQLAQDGHKVQDVQALLLCCGGNAGVSQCAVLWVGDGFLCCFFWPSLVPAQRRLSLLHITCPRTSICPRLSQSEEQGLYNCNRGASQGISFQLHPGSVEFHSPPNNKDEKVPTWVTGKEETNCCCCCCSAPQHLISVSPGSQP